MTKIKTIFVLSGDWLLFDYWDLVIDD